MSTTTSTKFACVGAEGTDWRDTAKAVLEKLEAIKTDGVKFNLGFLYISDDLVDDAVSILNLFRSVTGIEHWVGCSGRAISANQDVYSDTAAISAMVGVFPEDSFSLFTTAEQASEDTAHGYDDWAKTHPSIFAYIHAAMNGETDPDRAIYDLSHDLKTFMVGGLLSSRGQSVHIANAIMEEGISGVCFSDDIDVTTALSQGCQPIGDLHTITKCEEGFIYEIDERPPFEVFEEDLRQYVSRKSEVEHDFDDLDAEDLNADVEDMRDIPQAFQNLLRGDVHVAFLIPGNDKQDFLVRNIIGMDLEQNVLAVAHQPAVGDHILFAHRDTHTMREELTKMLLDLRKRVVKERGEFAPKAALYVSCIGRYLYHGNEHHHIDELGLIREICGDIPLAGYYAGGEVSNNRVYGYTGIITLFF